MARFSALAALFHCFLSLSIATSCALRLEGKLTTTQLAQEIRNSFQDFKFLSKQDRTISIRPVLEGTQVRLSVSKEKKYIGYFNFICKTSNRIELEGAFLKEEGTGVGEKILEHLSEIVARGTHLTFLSSNEATQAQINRLLKTIDTSEVSSKEGEFEVIEDQKLEKIQSEKMTQLIDHLIKEHQLEKLPVWARILHKSHWEKIKVSFHSNNIYFDALAF